jgi:lipopolysaccharide export system permease protein
MKLLSRYIAALYLKFWSTSLLALVMLVIIANLFGNLDSVFSSRAGLVQFAEDTIRSLPTILDLLIPMTALLATLFTFNSLGRSSELVAMQSVGVGLFRQLRPIGFVLIFIAALDYGNQNYLYRLLQRGDLAAAGPRLAYQWTTLRDQIVYARRISTQNGRINDVRIFQWAPLPFRLERIQRAGRVDRSETGPWLLSDVVTRRLEPTGWVLDRQATLERPREEFPDLFQQDTLDAHHMPLFELSDKIRQLESQGRAVELYEVEWYQKTAALFAPFVLVWFGTPLAQGHFRRGRASGEIMVGILGGLLFMTATEIVFTLGKGGFLAPIVAAWAVNAVYFALGFALLWRVR